MNAVFLAILLLPDAYEWKWLDDRREQIVLWENGVQLGNIVVENGGYVRHRPDGGFEDVYSNPPYPPPDWVKRHVPNYGIVASAISNKERISCNGRAVSLRDACKMIEREKEVPDDRHKLSLTFVGTEGECAAAMAELDAPEFSQLKSHSIVQCYRPDDVMVDVVHSGMPTVGAPGPVAQLEMPDGRAIWLEVNFEGADTISRLQRADPNYRPEDVPGPNNDGDSTTAWVVGAALIFLLLLAVFSAFSLFMWRSIYGD